MMVRKRNFSIPCNIVATIKSNNKIKITLALMYILIRLRDGFESIELQESKVSLSRENLYRYYSFSISSTVLLVASLPYALRQLTDYRLTDHVVVRLPS